MDEPKIHEVASELQSDLARKYARHAGITEMMRTRNLGSADPFRNCYTFFLETQYGESYEVTAEKAEFLAGVEPAIRNGLCVPQSTGHLILQRQTTLCRHSTSSLRIFLTRVQRTETRISGRRNLTKRRPRHSQSYPSKHPLQSYPWLT